MIDYFGLGDLIQMLDDHPNKEQVVPIGLGRPHSYRGYYEDLAFEPQKNVSVAQMLKTATFCVGREFQGYKGGWYKMDENSDCWIAYIGNGGGDKIGELLMRYMLGTISTINFEEPYEMNDWSIEELPESGTGRVY